MVDASGLAAGGGSALTLLRRAAAAGRPHAIALLDMWMDGMDGLTLAGQISAEGILAGLGYRVDIVADGRRRWRRCPPRPARRCSWTVTCPRWTGSRSRSRPGRLARWAGESLAEEVLDRARLGMLRRADDHLTKPLHPFALETRLLTARRVTSLHVQLGEHRRQLAEVARIGRTVGRNVVVTATAM